MEEVGGGLGSLLNAVLDGLVTPRWVVHGHSYTMVMEFLEVVMHGVRDVVEVHCEVQLASVFIHEVSPRGGRGKVGG